MAENLPVQILYRFQVADFTDMWNAMAHLPAAHGRGNFPFARQAMGLLEWTSWLCAADESGSALNDFAAALEHVELRYFTPLPAVCADFSDFALPSRGDAPPQAQLLWALFDLIRNGLAHQQQQIAVDLAPKGQWSVGLSGAEFQWYLGRVPREYTHHLHFWRQGDTVVVPFAPDFFFQDVHAAIAASGILDRGLTFPYMTRPRVKTSRRATVQGPFYGFDVDALEAALEAGRHERCPGKMIQHPLHGPARATTPAEGSSDSEPPE